MGEICCGVESSTAAVSEISPRSARRRRMEIRRFRFVSDGDGMELPNVLRRKRPSLDLAISPPAAILRKDSGCSTMESRVELASGAGAGTGTGTGASLSPTSSDSTSSSIPASSLLTLAESSLSERCPRYGVWSFCGRRRDMEDALSAHPYFFRRGRQQDEGRYHFFGVFDGHGCSHVAVSCKDRMHEIVAEELEGLGSGLPAPEVAWKFVMERSFHRMDAEVLESRGRGDGRPQNASCRCELQMPKCDHVGSTAVVAVVAPDRIVVANCGDSRAVLCRKGVPVPLSLDHKPDRPDELQRIEAAGGRVIYWDGARVLGVLAMSRAIGDGYLKPFVTSEPEVTMTERSGEDECLILASDGLWDVLTNEMACGVAMMCLRGSAPAAEGDVAGERGSDKACSDAAMLLTKLALARQSADNVSVVVIDLRTRAS